MKTPSPGLDPRVLWSAQAEDTAPDHAKSADAFGRIADVVVIGAGFTGLACALDLARSGRDVVVLEAARVGAGASGRNGGLLIPGLRREPGHYVRLLGETRTRHLVQMAESARATLVALVDDGLECDWHPGGHVQAAVHRGDVDMLAREVEALHRLSHTSIHILSREEVGAHVPEPGYAGGTLDTAGGWLQPFRLCTGLAHRVRAAGGTVIEHCPVLSIGAGAVVTQRGPMRARAIVVASDAYTGGIGGGPAPDLAARIMPVGNQIVATEPLGARLEAILPTRAAVSDTRFVLDYYRPTRDGRLVFGGGENYTPRPPRDVAAFVRPFLQRTFASLKGVALTHAWHGVVSVTRSRDPVIGRRDGVYWALGYSGQGIVLAHLGGRLLAQAIMGDEGGVDIAARLAPARFPGGPLARDPLYVAGMAWYALRDRLGGLLSG
jgi:gamma-glutamylputrescine oxidase